MSRAALVEQLREAVGALASRYEGLAVGDVNDWPLASLRATLGGKRDPRLAVHQSSWRSSGTRSRVYRRSASR